MLHHVSVVRLFQPFLDRESSMERIKSYHDHARSVTTTAIRELRQLIVLQDARHGWNNTIQLVIHAIVVTVFGTLEEVALQDQPDLTQEISEPYQGLLTCLRALSILATYVFYAQPLFRLLSQTCQSLGIPLPLDIISKLDDYQSEEWTKNAASVVSSQYIADIRKTASYVENERMDAIISQWDALSITEGSSKSSTTDSRTT